MMSEEDPFTLVQVLRRPRAHPCASRLLRARRRSRRSQEEASRSLLDVQAQLAHWRELSSSSSEMDHTEANQVKVHLTATIGELQVRPISIVASPSHRQRRHHIQRHLHSHRPPAPLVCSQLGVQVLTLTPTLTSLDPNVTMRCTTSKCSSQP